MSKAWTVGGMAVGLALAVSGRAIAGPLEIRHAGIGCVTVDRYAQIVAGASPAENVARAELQFRILSDADWYGVPMTADGGTWAAVLPRPGVPLTRFEYRIVMTGVDLVTVETAPIAVRVANVDAPCVDGPQSSSSVTAPIVVRVPPGAPVMPPVPAGFSPAGVVAAAEPAPPQSARKKWVAGAGAAGAVAAVVVAGSGSRPPSEQGLLQPPAEGLHFAYGGARPFTGTLSLSRDRLTVFTQVTGGTGIPQGFLWRFELWARTGDVRVCAVMAGEATAAATRFEPIQLTSPLVPTGACGARFETEQARFSVTVDGQAAYDQLHILRLTIEP